MQLSTFYGLVCATCFTLVGLWWTVVERHPQWRDDARLRRLAGGTYLSFLVPGLMSLFAQVDPTRPLVWRVGFGLSAVFGLTSTVALVRVDREVGVTGVFQQLRWVVGVLYGLVLLLGVVPEVARPLGFAPLQVVAFVLILLIVIAHGLTWDLMMRPDRPAREEELNPRE